MNNQKNKLEQKWLIAATFMVVLSATAVISGTSDYSLQKTFAENATTFKMVNPNQSTNKEFWINTVHLDGNTNLNPGVKCDTCPQNTPLHPAEQPPANSTILNLPLPLCNIFASTSNPSMRRTDQHEYFSIIVLESSLLLLYGIE